MAGDNSGSKSILKKTKGRNEMEDFSLSIKDSSSKNYDFMRYKMFKP